MVRQRNDRFEPAIVDLFFFDPVNVVSGQRRAPIRGREIDRLALALKIVVAFLSPKLGNDRKLFGVVRDKVEHLFRMLRMTMQRDAFFGVLA